MFQIARQFLKTSTLLTEMSRGLSSRVVPLGQAGRRSRDGDDRREGDRGDGFRDRRGDRDGGDRDDRGNRPPTDGRKCINHITLLGHSTGVPLVMERNDKLTVIFRLATNQIKRKANNELIKRSDFHQVYVYRPSLTRRAQTFITKGTRVYLEGTLEYSIRPSDQKMFPHIVADRMILVSGLNENANTAAVDDLAEAGDASDEEGGIVEEIDIEEEIVVEERGEPKSEEQRSS